MDPAAHDFRKGGPAVRRLLAPLFALVLLLTLGISAALAAEPSRDGGRVIISIDGPVDVPAGEHLDALVVANGDARIGGDVSHVLISNGTATASGATIGSLLVVNGTADLQAGTTVTGDVSTLHGTITAATGATVVRPVRRLEAELAALSIALIPLFLLLFLGAAVLAIVIGLFVAGIAGRQIRSVESLIGREPGPVLLAGVAGAIALPTIAVLLCITVIGAPIGLTMLLVVLPAMALLGWFVSAVWIGDWIVKRMRGSVEPERPYLASAVGIVVLAFAGLLPFVTMIATVFGFGAVLLATWRVMRGGSATAGAPGTPPPATGTGSAPQGPAAPGGPVGWGAGPSTPSVAGASWPVAGPDPSTATAASPTPTGAVTTAWPTPAPADGGPTTDPTAAAWPAATAEGGSSATNPTAA